MRRLKIQPITNIGESFNLKEKEIQTLYGMNVYILFDFIRRSTSFGALAPQSECVDVSKLFFPMLTSNVVMTATIFVTPPQFLEMTVM